MSYSISLPEGQDKSYERLDAAIKFAEKFAIENTVELEVVHAETGVVAFVATYVKERSFHPWERVETPKFSAPHFAGWRPAYTRKRIEATVYRSLDERKWLVYDGRTTGTRVVPTTKAACELTKAMGQGLHLPA